MIKQKIWLLLIFFHIRAEYLIFEKVNDQIQPIFAPEKYSKVYAILMKYQWPMSTASFTQMPQKEIIALTTQKKSYAEEEFIRNRLKEVDANLDLIFVPTITYELFVIYYWTLKSKTEQKSWWQTITEYTGFYKPFGTNPTWINATLEKKIQSKQITSWQGILNEYKALNNIKTTQDMHQTINEALFGYLKTTIDFNNDPKKLTQNYFLEITNKLMRSLKSEKGIAQISQLNLAQGKSNIFAISENFIQSKIVTDIIALEYQAHQNNTGLLYRALGSNKPEPLFFMIGKSKPSMPLESTVLIKNIYQYAPVTSEQLASEAHLSLSELNQKYKYIDWNSPARSISYGNSLFGGYFYDNGACAYWLMESNPIVYSLFINKFSYANGIINKLFFVSPFNTIVELFSVGELFHSRTISYHYKGIPESDFFRVPGLLGKTELLRGYFVREGNVLKHAYELSEFIEKNAHILRASFDASINESKKTELLEGQKDLTNLLKLMFLLSQNVKKEKEVDLAEVVRKLYKDMSLLSRAMLMKEL